MSVTVKSVALKLDTENALLRAEMAKMKADFDEKPEREENRKSVCQVGAYRIDDSTSEEHHRSSSGAYLVAA